MGAPAPTSERKLGIGGSFPTGTLILKAIVAITATSDSAEWR